MFGDMLFENTHSVEQLVDIKKKKKVDKVLLKVIKTIRSRTGISDWIRPESDLKKDFDISDKTITSICDVLNEYYQVNIEPQYTGTVKDMVQYIKCHQQTAADSIFLIDSATLDVDENNDTTDKPDKVEPKENLEVDPKIVKKSTPSTDTEEEIPTRVDTSVDISTENLFTNIFGMISNTIKSVWQGHSLATKQAQQFFFDKYDKVVNYINSNYGNNSKDKAKHAYIFEEKRPLWSLDSIVNMYERSRRQFEFIANLPVYEQAEKQDENKKDPIYESKLKKALPKKLVPIGVPEKEQLTYQDAGYLDAHDFKRAYQYWSSGFIFYYDKAKKNLANIEIHYPAAVKYLKSMGVFDVVPPSGKDNKSRKLNKRYLWAFAWMNDVTAMFKYLQSDVKQLKTDTEEKEKQETVDNLKAENARLRKENEEHIAEKVNARKKAEEEAAKKAQEEKQKEPKKESGQESYSMENLQIPKTDNDWGSMLNSF